ncbi:TIGR01777 family oxidoreductase [Flocculibacter collagenilyticus]|uniref:TIGR01777 family oxidoreductase n=1 Tax=Flocculibacter collagenilyticus TaxID=2744479 RepID=UPI0018F3E0D7|nr:TIGR01777 family oxidoreductase [Flocculibacter collagenilyticus]
MNILITGGTGFIGCELTKHLKNHNYLTILSRHPEKVYLRIGHDVKAVSTLDGVDFDQLDAIINLAGEPIANKRWSEQQKRKITKSRWHLTEQITKRIQEATSPPHTLLSGSAVGYYGRQGHVPITEDFDRCHPEFSHEVCKKWEELAMAAQSDRTRVCVLRTGVVLGPKGGALSKMLPAYKACLGGPISSGKQVMSWIHLNDTVAAILFLLENRHLNGPFNLTAPNPVTNKEFSHILSKTLSRPDFLTMPKFVMETLFGEMSELLLYGQNVHPKRLQDAGFRFRFGSLNKALENIIHGRH